DEEERDDAGESLERVEPGAEVVVAERVIELRLPDPHEAVGAVEEERSPDEEDLRREEDLTRDRADPAHEILEALATGQDEAVLEEDVREEVGADREDPRRRVQATQQELPVCHRPPARCIPSAGATGK